MDIEIIGDRLEEEAELNADPREKTRRKLENLLAEDNFTSMAEKRRLQFHLRALGIDES